MRVTQQSRVVKQCIREASQNAHITWHLICHYSVTILIIVSSRINMNHSKQNTSGEPQLSASKITLSLLEHFVILGCFNLSLTLPVQLCCSAQSTFLKPPWCINTSRIVFWTECRHCIVVPRPPGSSGASGLQLTIQLHDQSL